MAEQPATPPPAPPEPVAAAGRTVRLRDDLHRLTRFGMEQVLREGGSVEYGNRIITDPARLPSPAQMVADDEARRQSNEETIRDLLDANAKGNLSAADRRANDEQVRRLRAENRVLAGSGEADRVRQQNEAEIQRLQAENRQLREAKQQQQQQQAAPAPASAAAAAGRPQQQQQPPAK